MRDGLARDAGNAQLLTRLLERVLDRGASGGDVEPSESGRRFDVVDATGGHLHLTFDQSCGRPRRSGRCALAD
jgi:hypothetical protein